MSFIQEIRGKIRSVSGTQKITRAMEMVAMSKLRKAQVRMLASRPYVAKLRTMMDRVLLKYREEQSHPYLQVRDPKRIGLILITSDRGLCGGLNTQLFKTVLEKLRELQISPTQVEWGLIGHKATSFVARLGGQVFAQTERLGDVPALQEVIGILKVMGDRYQQQQLDRVWIACNGFVNTMVQKPQILSLLPIIPNPSHIQHTEARWDYLYEPEAQSLLHLLITRYIESQVYQAVVENLACEQAARRLAMKNATESADELIRHLHKTYHKARQSAITQELAEIVSGAEGL